MHGLLTCATLILEIGDVETASLERLNATLPLACCNEADPSQYNGDPTPCSEMFTVIFNLIGYIGQKARAVPRVLTPSLVISWTMRLDLFDRYRLSFALSSLAIR